MASFLLPMSMISLLSTGAIFGFFYAWICSTMWGLDAADPRIAIAAMQAMNASVRNWVFFPAFFLTPVFAGITALIATALKIKRAAWLFALSAVLYFGGALLVTMLVNVPMNNALAAVAVPAEINEAQGIWTAYSEPWQRWNILRTVFSGAALLANGMALYSLKATKT